MSEYTCIDCSLGPCTATTNFKPRNCLLRDGEQSKGWSSSTPPEFVCKGDWVFDTGADDYAHILEVKSEHKQVAYQYLRGKRVVMKPFDYASNYFRKASLLPFNDSDMHKLVGKPIRRKNGKETCLVLNCTERLEETTVLILSADCLHDRVGPDQLLEDWEMTDGAPCGVFCRADENGNWL